MRGAVRLPVWPLLGGVLLVLLVSGNEAWKCQFPDVLANPADGKFYISMVPNPTMYTPGKNYTVILQGAPSNKFEGFVLLAESVEGGDDVGYFQIFDQTTTKFSTDCNGAVTNTTNAPKTDISVTWTGPPLGSRCVNIKAIVNEYGNIWYKDDRFLSKTLCEDEQEVLDHQPNIVDPCCACEEAKYEVTFEGLWSRHTHPKDFPDNPFLTKFSDIIGASHTVDYRFWKNGEEASEGLRHVAEDGTSIILEGELKDKSKHIRTIIKARGMSYPNITGKTFAMFRVDSTHHLMSLVSKIDPSPDWFVGVSGLELCLPECAWVKSKVLNLYPYDAGTDNGSTYLAKNQPTYPRDLIRYIKSPDDEMSPFYDPNGNEIKPMAKLHLTRLHLYEKDCPAEQNNEEGGDGFCATTGWSKWGPCSTTCGPGTRLKQRYFRNETLAYKHNCLKTTDLSQRGNCRYQPPCPVQDNEDDILNDPRCELTDWDEWSSCSSNCSKGTRTRSRRFKHKGAIKDCVRGPNIPKLEENIECDGEYTNCPEEEVLEKDGCLMAPWSEWTPCSATCGKGVKERSRKSFFELSRQSRGMNEEDVDIETEDDDPCDGVRKYEQVTCDTSISCEVTTEEAKAICRLPQERGRCRNEMKRWFFDYVTEQCEQFLYSGCQGNRNNFDAKSSCEQLCGIYRDTTDEPHYEAHRSWAAIQSRSQIRPEENINSEEDNELDAERSSNEVVDCVWSVWSKWTPCSVSCGRGFRTKTREILIEPTEGGLPCPKKLLKRKICKIPCHKSRKQLNDNYSFEESSNYGK